MKRPGLPRPDLVGRYPPVPSWFHLLFVGFSVVLLFGALLDGYAHTRLNVTSFVTWWHGLIYGSITAIAGTLIVTAIDNRFYGFQWTHALPRGYGWSLVGIGIFAFTGPVDLLWHRRFGIEGQTDALVSPPHISLAIGSALVVAGPLRAGKHRPVRTTQWDATTAAIFGSIILVFAVVCFFTQWLIPISNGVLRPVTTVPPIFDSMAGATPGSLGGSDPAYRLGVAGFVFYALIVASTVLSMVRHRVWARGFITGTLAIGNGLLTLYDQRYECLPALLLIAIAAELYVWMFRPSASRIVAFRSLGAALPAATTALLLVTVRLDGGSLGWSAHASAGTVALAAGAGVLVSYLMIPWVPQADSMPPPTDEWPPYEFLLAD